MRNNLILAMAVLMAACSGEDAPPPFHPPKSEVVIKDTYRVMVASLLPDGGDCAKSIAGGFLCDSATEATVAAQIAAAEPDVVFLSQVATKRICDDLGDDAVFVSACSRFGGEAQPRRVLGPDYTIVCEPESGLECVGIHRKTAEISTCPTAQTCEDGMEAAPVASSCNPLYTASAINLNFGLPQQLRLVHVHVNADEPVCASAQIESFFFGVQGGDSIVGDRGRPVLLAGDFGTDPFRLPDLGPSKTLERTMEPDYFYVYGSDATPPETNGNVTRELLLSNTVTGKCFVMGQKEGTVNLDGAPYGDGPLATAAVLCELKLHE